MKYLIPSIFLFTTVAHANFLSPSSLRLKVYKLAVSESVNCSDPITVVDNGNTPSFVDFKGTPNLGSGNLVDGTYPCIIIEMADRIQVTPEEGGVVCTTATITQDLCGDPDDPGSEVVGASTLINGTSVNCRGDREDKVAMYLSTSSTCTNFCVDPFKSPASTTDNGILLGSALVVSGSTAGIFKVDADNKICDGDTTDCPGQCEMFPPEFTFSKQ
jgi:hypothetical protein